MSKPDNATKLADALMDWMMDQRHQGENILHSVVCCDFVSHTRFTQELARIIRENSRN